MKSGSYWAYREAGALNQEPEDEVPSSCPECGILLSEVHDGHIQLYDAHADDFLPVAVNPVTGCLCSPEDFEEESPEAIAARLREYDEAMRRWAADESRKADEEELMQQKSALEAEIERLGYLYDENERLKRALMRARDRLADAKSQVMRGAITPRTASWLQRAIAEIDAAMGDELASAYVSQFEDPAPEPAP